ncbi:MAG: T9SS type A sorting domain-containing protein [Cryomorphaceae bacterium]|nr:T9SS type A sorting domain-containing protein [Cryomorphaceae bacterium]
MWLATDLGIELITDYGTTSTIVQSGFSAHSITQSGQTLWVGGTNTIARFDGSNWTYFINSGIPTPFTVTDIKVINNVVWLIANNQLYRMLGNGFINMNRNAASIIPAPSGNRFSLISTGTQYTCLEYNNGVWDSLPAIDPTLGVRRLNSTTYFNQTIWAITHSRNLVRFNRNTREWVNVKSLDGALKLLTKDNHIYCISSVKIWELNPFTENYTDSSQINRSSSEIISLNKKVESIGSRIAFIALGVPYEFYIEVDKNADQSLDLNNFEWPVPPHGAIGKNRFGFDDVKIDNKPAIYTITPWISGHINNQPFTNSPTYGQYDRPFASGPITDVHDRRFIEKYDRVWKVSRGEIEQHKQSFADSNYTMPEDIATWPGNGDHTKGEAFNLAPFVDVNGNGIYEPEQGDYPDILGHQAVYTIFSNKRQNMMIGGSREGPWEQKVEFHLMMYAFDSAEIPALHHSVFLNYRVFNRGDDDLDDATFTLFTDWGMSNPTTSACGSDSTENLFFGYNINNFDAEFGSSPVAVAGSLLNQPLDGHMYFMRSDYSNINMTDPRYINEAVRYINYRWKNESTLIRQTPSGPNSDDNGTGYLATNTDSTSTKWAFNSPDNWYFPPSDMHDTRSLANTKVGTIKPGEHRCLEFAFTHGYDPTDNSGDWQNALTRARSHMSAAKSVYDNLNSGCMGAVLSNETFNDHRITYKTYPNPLSAGQTMFIETNDRINGIEMIATSGQQLQVGFKSTGSGYVIDIPKETASGIYLLRIHTAHKGLVIEKVLVQ